MMMTLLSLTLTDQMTLKYLEWYLMGHQMMILRLGLDFQRRIRNVLHEYNDIISDIVKSKVRSHDIYSGL